MVVSSVVGLFESVVAQLTLIVCFQSLVLDMAGNVGTQSLAVTIRVLMDSETTGAQKRKLVWKEARVGLMNGAILGAASFALIGAYLLLRGEAALADLFTDVYDSDEAQTAKLVWSVPKFDVNSDLELTDTLKMLGVTDAFDDTRADFSPLADFDEPAAVTQVQHAARVKIDEEGCEAAAFTAIMANATSAMPEDLPVVEMELDRPFAFAITGADGLPLFVGTVNTME